MNRLSSLGKRLLGVALASLLGLVVVGVEAVDEDRDTVRVDIRVWQSLSNPSRMWLSARPEGGRWGPTERLVLETNREETWREGDRTVPGAAVSSAQRVRLRVEQRVREPLQVYLRVYLPGRLDFWSSWGPGERLPLDKTSERGTYRYSDHTVARPRLSLPRACGVAARLQGQAANPELVEDCVALLAWRDTLAGTATLNWSGGRAMSDWTGVTVAGTPRRVTKVELADGGLTGEISGLLGELTGLTELRLNGNALTGRIPSKVALLTDLTHVSLAGNALTGCLPPSLRAVANHDLATLGLPDCGAPVDFSYGEHPLTGEETLTAGTYQVIWEAGAGDSPPLVFDVPPGLELVVDGWVLQGPTADACTRWLALGGSIGVLLREANGEAFIGLDVYAGDEWNRTNPDPEHDARLWPFFDRVVESAWIDRPSCPPAEGNPGFSYALDKDAEGWTVEFADLPADYDQDLYALDSGHRPLPEGLAGGGIYVQGHNRSDDLFMYLKRQVGGLHPNTVYSVSVSIELATSVHPGLVGIGGSPGESVFVKAGAATIEPTTAVDDIGHLRMNIDKGNQSTGGEAMVVLGDISHADATIDTYAIKTLTNADAPLTVTTDDEGSLWLIVGTDSGFEGLTSLYYARIAYGLNSVQPPDAADTGSGLSAPLPGGRTTLDWVVFAVVGVALAGLGLRARGRRPGL